MTRLVPIRVHVRAAALGLVVCLAWSAAPDRPWPKAPRSRTRPRSRPRRMTAATPSTAGARDSCGSIPAPARFRNAAGPPAPGPARSVPDERAALESEIARLQRDNAALKKSLLARGLNCRPASWPKLRRRRRRSRRATCRISPPRSPRPPSEAELDRAFAFMKNVWRRLVDMMVDLQRDMQRKS